MSDSEAFHSIELFLSLCFEPAETGGRAWRRVSCSSDLSLMHLKIATLFQLNVYYFWKFIASFLGACHTFNASVASFFVMVLWLIWYNVLAFRSLDLLEKSFQPVFWQWSCSSFEFHASKSISIVVGSPIIVPASPLNPFHGYLNAILMSSIPSYTILCHLAILFRIGLQCFHNPWSWSSPMYAHVFASSFHCASYLLGVFSNNCRLAAVHLH